MLRLLKLVAMFIPIILLYMSTVSFYSSELESLNTKISTQDSVITKAQDSILSLKNQLDSINNLQYKLKAQDSIRIGGRTEFFRIYKKDVMIESTYDIDTVYINKIYDTSEKVGIEPWIQLFYAHLENRVNPYNLRLLRNKGIKKTVVSNKYAYNIMQMTHAGFKDVNRHLPDNEKLSWEKVKYDVDTNILASAYFIKYNIMPIHEEFSWRDDVANISFWFYNGGPTYFEYKLMANNLKSHD